MLEAEIKAVFAEHPEILFGFTDIPYSEYADQYRSALVFAVPYGEQLTTEDYTEERFENGIQSARVKLEAVVAQVETVLRNETELLAPFSFKTAAARAGLGWFGKNDVVITRQYGPRVRLSAILIDAVFEYGQPKLRSECPEDCTLCVDICPCRALKNRLWTPDTPRSEIIDYHRCNRMRSAFIPKLGRKSACGLCMAVCPFGRSAPGHEEER